MNEFLLQSIILVILIAINAFYVTAEFALLNFDEIELDTIIKSPNGRSAPWAKWFLSLKRSASASDIYFTVVQVGITLSSLGLGAYTERALSDFMIHAAEQSGFVFSGLAKGFLHLGAAVLSLFLLTYIHVVVGEMVPKTAAMHRPEQAAGLIYRPMQISNVLFYPFAYIINMMNNFCLWVLRVPVEQNLTTEVSKEKLSSALEESIVEHQIDDDAGEWAQELLKFDENIVRNVMIPRTKVFAFQADTTVQEALRQVKEFRCSRYPIYTKNLDDTDKLVLVRELYKALRRGRGDDPVSKYGKNYPVIHEFVTLKNAFNEMCSASVHMAAVVDEKGGIAGIVTMEDLMEEVVGEVYDEFEEEEPPSVGFSYDRWEIEGIVELDDLVDLMKEAMAEEFTRRIFMVIHGAMAGRSEERLKNWMGSLSRLVSDKALEERASEIVEEAVEESGLGDEIREQTEALAEEELGSVENMLEVRLEEEEAETIGGLVMALLGKLPQKGDEVTYCSVLKIQVQKVTDRAPAWLEIPVLNPDELDKKYKELESRILAQAGERINSHIKSSF